MSRAAKDLHWDGVTSLGCVKCTQNGYEDTPCEVHHCGTYGGGSQDHFKVIGLCPMHHRWKLAIDKEGKNRRFIEETFLAIVANECPCPRCKTERKNHDKAQTIQA